MSIENALANFAAAADKLADAMTNYAAVMEKYGAQVIGLNEGTVAAPAPKTAAPPAEEKPKAKPGRPAKATKAAAAPADEDDGFGDDGEAARDPVTADDVKTILLKIRDANKGDKTPAIAIIKKFGYSAIPEIQEKDYADIADAAQAWLDSNT